jgi:non-canonical (house-cleaning) NTP pyrophosphatase
MIVIALASQNPVKAQAALYEPAIIFALLPFKNPELYT